MYPTSVFLNKRVLITGASGFIGSHLAKRMWELGAHVSVTQHNTEIDNTNYNVFPCDLRNSSRVYQVVQDVIPHFVFHLASQAIVNDAEDQVHNTFGTNAMGTLNLMTALCEIPSAMLHGVIVASTDKVYGRHEDLPYTEHHELRGNCQVYETSKLCEDHIAQMAYNNWELPIGITRCGNVYGGGDFHWDRLIPGIIRSYIAGDVPTIRSTGQYYRDYVYIDDIVDGYVKFAEYKYYSSNELDIVNLGTGKPSRVLDVVAMLADHFQFPQFPQISGRAVKEIHRQYVGSDLAMELFKWKPEVSLANGLAQTVDWYKEYFRVNGDFNG
jgi:CDP-glucose 4,6-dehydratase